MTVATEATAVCDRMHKARQGRGLHPFPVTLLILSVNDLATLGHSIGFSPTLDNPKSAKYQPAFNTTSGASGNGYSNNRVFAASSDNQTALGVQNTTVGNAANQYKIGRYVDTTNTGGQGIYGASNTLMTANQLNNEFRPYYTVSNIINQV